VTFDSCFLYVLSLLRWIGTCQTSVVLTKVPVLAVVREILDKWETPWVKQWIGGLGRCVASVRLISNIQMETGSSAGSQFLLHTCSCLFWGWLEEAFSILDAGGRWEDAFSSAG